MITEFDVHSLHGIRFKVNLKECTGNERLAGKFEIFDDFTACQFTTLCGFN